MAANIPEAVRSDYFARIEDFQREAPVDLNGLTASYGIGLTNRYDWNDDISGRIVSDLGKEGGYRIEINGNHHPNRRRFTLAHELAHFLLHRDQIDGGIEDDGLYRSRLSDRREVEANKMAANVLMPYGLIRSIMDERGRMSVSELARTLQVSEHALRIRLNMPLD